VVDVFSLSAEGAGRSGGQVVTESSLVGWQATLPSKAKKNLALQRALAPPNFVACSSCCKCLKELT
jgi:hypothetical protein